MAPVIESAVPIAPPASKLEQLIAKQAALELWWAACVELEAELTSGELGGPAVRYSFRSLNEILVLARATPSEQASAEADQARELYLEAWALSRIGQFSMSDESLGLGERALDDSLALFARAATLLHLESPPLLTAAPSISRTRNKAKKLDLAPRDGWVCGLLVDYARAEATRSFAACLARSEEGEEGSETGEELLANMIELACRRNVQALFTPVIEGTSSNADAAAQASTVLGNTRLLADMISMSDWSDIVSQRRVAWATHIADVNYVQASMCANRLLESAGLAARLLVDKNASEVEKEQTRRTLEATVKRLIPFEVQQGKSLLGLGKIMMAACRNSKQVGGGDLMKESIAVLTRGKAPRTPEQSRADEAQRRNTLRMPTRRLVAPRDPNGAPSRSSGCCVGYVHRPAVPIHLTSASLSDCIAPSRPWTIRAQRARSCADEPFLSTID